LRIAESIDLLDAEESATKKLRITSTAQLTKASFRQKPTETASLLLVDVHLESRPKRWLGAPHKHGYLTNASFRLDHLVSA
jgi:hypothetical protein